MLVIDILGGILQQSLPVYGQRLSCGCEKLQHSFQSPVLCSTRLSQSWTCIIWALMLFTAHWQAGG